MKVAIATVLKDFDDKPLTWPERRAADGSIIDPEKPLTLRKLAIEALNRTYAGDVADGEERMKRFRLALKIATAGDSVDLVAEEIVVLKKMIGNGFTPLAVGRAYELLDG